MKIKAVSDRTGLSRKTIRFYESRNLFQPEKTMVNGKEFRDYSEENIQTLLKIATLRRARFTVEEIHRMLEAPEETSEIFHDYRERLRDEAQELLNVLAVADAIREEELTSPDELAARMEPVTAELPLPTVDVHPRFRYLDELEAQVASRKRRNVTEQELHQKQLAARNAALFAAFSSAEKQNGISSRTNCYDSGFDLSPSQKIATFNLLLHSKDD